VEHRWGQRQQIQRRVRLRTRSGVIGHGVVSDVSISGAFIVSPLPTPLLSYVQVQFTTADHGYRFGTAIEGQVVRRTPRGFGLEWCEFAPQAVCALASTNELHAPLDTGVARETSQKR
jgi:PilZ domain-containing protein